MSHAPAFWNRIAEKYAADPISDMTTYEHTLARTASYLHSGDRVLEIGGGTGTTALKLAPRVGEYTGSDFSAEMVRIAQGKAQAEGADNLRFVVAAAEDRFDADSLDAVLAFNLLHLVKDPGAVFRAAHHGLKPGGYFISKSFCFEGRWRALWPIIRPMALIGRWPSVTFFSARWLEREMEKAGFEIVERDYHKFPLRFIVARKV